MHDEYISPLCARYASREMKYIFSPDKKFKTWRKLWVALAEAEKELGVPISDEQIAELRKYQDVLSEEIYQIAEQREREVRHDVMAHVYAYCTQCPKARHIIHLGATSCYVGDNTDLIIMDEGMELIRKKVVNVIAKLSEFAKKYKAMPTLGYTHLQAGQLTTVGKRATMWIYELLMDLESLNFYLGKTRLLGSKGTTGTQASFMELFNDDQEKVSKLDRLIAQKMGYSDVVPVSGQTYSRKVDSQILNVLSGIAQSASKFANDMRLLQHMKEIEEPFEEAQIGSSAMAYKRNPMRSERICAIARYIIINALNPAITSSVQWFERTLDDSANRRISIPEAFLAVDSILTLYLNIASGLVVYPNVIRQHIDKELPFMATENILMDAVKKGGDRQELHEKIRLHSMEAGRVVKEKGGDNDLIKRIVQDAEFGLSEDGVKEILRADVYTGRAEAQVIEFLKEWVRPVLNKYKHLIGIEAEVNV